MMTRTTSTARLVALLVTVTGPLSLTACSTGGGEGDDGEKTLTVLAASSLTGSFEELATSFEEDHPGVEVRFSFESSTTLAQQLADGAPGDVLATADLAAMDLAGDAVDTGAEVRGFVSNTLTLVTPSTDPVLVTSVQDLEDPDIDYVVCVDTAPCGKVTAEVLDDEGVEAEPASEEVDVKSVLAKVVGDEADAGFVYASDAVSAGADVTTVDLPSAADHPTDYAIAPAADPADPDLAADWVDWVTGEEGQSVLREAGFTVGGS